MDAVQGVILLVSIVGLVVMGVWAIASDFYKGKR